MDISPPGTTPSGTPAWTHHRSLSSPSIQEHRESFAPGDRDAIGAGKQEILRRMKHSGAISTSTSMLFDDPQSRVRKISTDLGHPCGAPVLMADGTIIATSGFEFMTVDSDKFTVTQSVHYPQDADNLRLDAPAFAPDGTFYAVTSDREHIRGIKDGQEVLSLEPGGRITTPLALSGEKLAYCTEDGKLNILGLDGKIERKRKVPTDPSKEAWMDRPVAVQFGKNGLIYVQTRDDRVLSYGPRGLSWTATVPRPSQEPQVIQIEESDDGSTLFLGGKTGIVALDASSGKEKWSCELGDSLAVAPVRDAAGTLYGLTEKGTVAIISAEGKVESSFSTGQECSTVNQSCSRLRVDGHGNICVTPNAGKFMVFDRSGLNLMTIEKNKLFREVDYLHDFILSADGLRAFLIPGTGSFAEITLPLSIHEQAAAGTAGAASDESVSPDVQVDDQCVWIDGFRLKRHSHVARFTL
jgi:outer membrane protein assembly factor BamB